jgi:HK97 family phage portal protein
VRVVESKNNLFYKVEGVEDFINSENMIHVPNMGDGCIGKSVIAYMKEDASLMMDVRKYGESFFGRGGKPAGLLIPKQTVTTTQRQETKDSFAEAKKQGGEVAMPYGWEYKEISVPPSDAEWVLSQDHAISDVARWFGVPTQKLGDSKVKYSNVEFMGIEFLQDTMAPIACKFENEYTNKLFTLPGEQNLYAEFNLDAYLRADSVSKAEAIAKRIQNAQLTPNEGRALDNRSAIEGGDELFIQGATVPLTLQKQMFSQKTPQQRTSIKKKIIEAVMKGEDPQTIIESIIGNDGKGY